MNSGDIAHQDLPAAQAAPSDANGKEPSALQRLYDDDRAWADSDPNVQLRYSGQSIAVHRRKIVGVGFDGLAALEDALARPGCPPRHELSLVKVFLQVADAENEFAWCLEDETAQYEHCGMVAAIHGRTILASGLDRVSAWKDAQKRPDCPPEEEVRFVLVPTVREPDLIQGI
jgi:hypothetical protein